MTEQTDANVKTGFDFARMRGIVSKYCKHVLPMGDPKGWGKVMANMKRLVPAVYSEDDVDRAVAACIRAGVNPQFAQHPVFFFTNTALTKWLAVANARSTSHPSVAALDDVSQKLSNRPAVAIPIAPVLAPVEPEERYL